MAVTEQRQLFAPQIESLAEQYAKSMGTQAAKPFTAADITAMAPQVAPQTALQQQATARTTSGLGAYQPYVSAAGQDLTSAGAQLGTAQTGLGAIGTQYADPAVAGIQQAQGTLGGVSPYISAAGTGLAGASGTLGTAGTDLTGAQTAMGGAQQYITGAAGLSEGRVIVVPNGISFVVLSQPSGPIPNFQSPPAA